jgi:hypothetical protein
MADDLALGLLGGGVPGTANPPTAHTTATNPSPDLTRLEGRAVSAAFLRWFKREKVTQRLREHATHAATPYLEAQIVSRRQEIAELQEAGTEEGSAEGRKRHRNKLTNAKRWLGWLEEDLEKRKREPYVTARDVHRYIVKVETDELMCRYCELPGMAERCDLETGRHWFGLANHFFSYNWDSPFDDVVDAICTHSDMQVAVGQAPGYYWVDNFAINQHERTTKDTAQQQRDTPGADNCWRASRVACPVCAPCAACNARSEDLPDWDRMEQAAQMNSDGALVGFERVIRHTRSTLMLMEPYHRPRAPTRVWCLFEGYCTLMCGGTLEAVLGSVQQCDLRLNLNTRFGELKGVVSALDSRTADATGEVDKVKIFGAIEQLPGGHDALDAKIRHALQQWLCEASEGVIYRTDPQRPALDSAAMAREAAEIGEGRWP